MKNIVIIGTTGTGKSTLGNSLLGFLDNPETYISGSLFRMSATASSCTLDCISKNGHWLGDQSKPIRIIDTPGHGDGYGKNHEMREALVSGIRKEKFINVFIWVKNSQSPRVDSQDTEFLDIFGKIFGPAFMKNMIVVFTRFDQSAREEKRRVVSGVTLEALITEFRETIGDTQGVIPIFAIDAIHDSDDPVQRQKYLESCEALWNTIQVFNKTPVDHIQNVKEKITVLQEELQEMTDEIIMNRAAYAKEMEKLKLHSEEIQKLATMKKKRLQQLELIFQEKFKATP